MSSSPTTTRADAAAFPSTDHRDASVPGDAALRQTRGRWIVQAYLLAAAATLAPGLAIRLGFDAGPTDMLRQALVDIRFGSGLRFWLGVAGASMIGLLLLYPLRKMLSRRRTVGSVGGWFHLHMLFGLFGPVLVLYHCNFGHGGSNANVALWSMLTVAISGIVGYFVYGRASRDFYTAKQQVRHHRDAIAATLPDLDPVHQRRQTLIAALDAAEAELLTPRRGLIACLRARVRVERDRRDLAQDLSWLVDESAALRRLDQSEHLRLRALVSNHLKAFFRLARAGATRSIREQLWARWRLMHLPVFLIMIVATVLHVIAVWGIDDGRPATEAADPPSTARTEAGTVTMIKVKPQSVAKRAIVADATVSKQSPREKTEFASEPPPKLIAAPAPAAAPMRTAEPKAATPPAPPVHPIAKAQPIPPAAPPAAPAPATPPPAEISAVYGELQRRMETPPMALGAGRPRGLAEQIAELKDKQRNGLFKHTEQETGFALTGKHLKVDCASCHTAPLKETASANPRECVACHKKDDVHRGRRPNCGNCHTPTRWSDVIKR